MESFGAQAQRWACVPSPALLVDPLGNPQRPRDQGSPGGAAARESCESSPDGGGKNRPGGPGQSRGPGARTWLLSAGRVRHSAPGGLVSSLSPPVSTLGCGSKREETLGGPPGAAGLLTGTSPPPHPTPTPVQSQAFPGWGEGCTRLNTCSNVGVLSAGWTNKPIFPSVQMECEYFHS